MKFGCRAIYRGWRIGVNSDRGRVIEAKI